MTDLEAAIAARLHDALDHVAAADIWAMDADRGLIADTSTTPAMIRLTIEDIARIAARTVEEIETQ